jgi:tape measure domain-containing protein
MASDLVFVVKAKTDSAASSFGKLAKSILPVKKESDAAAKSMAAINKTKVAPKVDTAQVKKLETEISRLQKEMADRLTLDVHADTSDIRRKLSGLRSTLKEVQRSQPAITPKANVGPITRGLDTLKSKASGIKSAIGEAFSSSRIGQFASKVGSDLSTVGGVIGGLMGKLGQFGSAVGGIFKSIGVPVLGAGLAAITALGVGLGATALKALDLADAMERNKLQMNSFIHNTKTTNKLLGQVQDYADHTPFEFPELAQASKMLLGLGVSTSKVVPQLKKIGDVAAQSGASVEDLTRIYTQMVAAGRLNAGDMNQLVNAGISAWPLLAKSMGKSVAEVRKLSEQGKIGGQEIQKFWDLLAKGAAGSTTALANTFSGQVSTLKDTINGVLRDIGDALLPFAKIIVPQITKGTEGLGAKIVGMLPGWINAVAEGAKSLIDMGGQLLGGLKTITVGFLNGISSFQSAMGSMLGSLAGFASQMGGLVAALAFLNPALAPVGKGLTDAGKGMQTAADGMNTAAGKTAEAAGKAGKQWDEWIAKYNAGAAKAKQAITAGQLKSALVISTGKATSDVAKFKAELEKLGKKKSTPKVEAKIDKAKASLDKAQRWLDQLDKYEANPKLLAQDLASGKVKYVKGQLVSVPKSKQVSLTAKDGVSKPAKNAKGAVQDVPNSKTTKLNATDNTSWKAHNARDAVQDIPTSWTTKYTLDYHVNYSSKANPSGFSPSSTPGSINTPNRSAPAMAPAQVTLAVRDEKLTDLFDVRINQRTIRAVRFVRRRGVLL